ncbi:MAG TPA: flagellar biosynthesis anti-sigma factor FlgM [Acidobacteriaceae bacterium]|jgi:flagellar biosynthesis anti-sigma factor FlgM|nr:flagellar biosynthesis anti-sigma factor FlgM [Acidobacteriaceae bacterium]
MNVNNDVQGMQQLFPSQEIANTETAAPQHPGAAAVSVTADEATLSPAASMAAEAAQDSGVRMDQVTAVQQAIAAGTYSVPSSAVAGRIIDQMLGQ